MDYYTFELDDEPIGYYEQEDKNGILYSNARILVEGEKLDNPFWVRHKGGKVLAYKFGAGDWIDFKEDEDVYPSSAIKLILGKLEDGSNFCYRMLIEGTGQISPSFKLERKGNKIEEFNGDQLQRTFTLKNGNIREYGWGGTAVSRRVGGLREAKEGTAFE